MASEHSWLARNLAPGGQGSAGSRRAGRGGRIRKFPGNSFPFRHFPPPFLGCRPLRTLGKRKWNAFRVSKRLSSSFWHSGVWRARGSAGRRRAGVRGLRVGGERVQSPGGSWGSRARARSVPELGEASRSFGPVQLKLVSHEPRGSGNPGSGRGRARPEGAAQSTYMRRGPADGCQEFPMRGDGGKFGQLGLANGEPREGSAPSPRPRPPLLPQLQCVRLAQCAWRLGLSGRLRQAVSELDPPPPPPPLAAAFASSAAAEPGAGELARPRQPSPAQPIPDSLPTPGQQAAAAATGREGGGRNPAPSTRSPSWTIMIPSKPMTTCSPKRTGIETCSWTRPGRSSRERSATAPAHRSPRPRATPPAGLWAPGCEPVPGAHERGRGMRGRSEEGCWVTGAGRKGERPGPRARERRGQARGGGAAGGQVALGRAIQATRLYNRTSPGRARRGGGAREAGAESPARWLLAPDRFSLPFPAP